MVEILEIVEYELKGLPQVRGQGIYGQLVAVDDQFIRFGAGEFYFSQTQLW
jgi:hypothetical protein